MNNNGELSWALVVATYNRPDLLCRCVKMALRQTRLPVEIIIIDGSRDWEGNKKAIEKECGAMMDGIRFEFQPAKKLSSAFQRNQGVEMSQADVVFMLDDDSLMYPDCAQKVMEIYEADSGKLISGVTTMQVKTPPDVEENPGSELGKTPAKKSSWLRDTTRKILNADSLFNPYDEAFPMMPIPPGLENSKCFRIQLFHGCRMTYRREVAMKEPFNDWFVGYSNGEDWDMSYRASRHGALVQALEARLTHLESGSGRPNIFLKTLLSLTNPVVCHKRYSTDLKRSKRRQLRLILRRIVIYFIKDVAAMNFRFPQTRGAAYALRMASVIFKKSNAELQGWYEKFVLDLQKQKQG